MVSGGKMILCLNHILLKTQIKFYENYKKKNLYLFLLKNFMKILTNNKNLI